MSDDTGTFAGNDDADEPQPTRNLRDRLARRRQELSEEAASGDRTPLTLPIPGYGNELWAEFKYSADAWDRLKRIGQAAVKSRHPRKELHAAMDTLSYACSNILVSEDDGLTFEPYAPEGGAVGFDDQLATLMGFPAKNAREVVTKVFNNDLAVTAMSNRVSEWMQGEDEEVSEDFQ